MSEALKQQVEAYRRFSTERFFGQQMDPIAEPTFEKYLDHMRYVQVSASSACRPVRHMLSFEARGHAHVQPLCRHACLLHAGIAHHHNAQLPACRGFLGWLHNVRGHPLMTLSFAAAIPSSTREGVSVAYDYLQWLR